MKKNIGKSIFVRKLTFFIICSLFCISAMAQHVTIKSQTTTLANAMAQIEKQTGYKFFYNNSQLNTNRSVKVSMKNESLHKALAKLFAGTDIGYKLVDKTIVLTKKETTNTPAPVNNKSQQAKTKVSGTVVDKSGDPVIGAVVKSQDGTVGAVTDINGNFSLDAPIGSNLTISYVGYDNLTLKAQRSMDVVMEPSDHSLDEVVVVGFGTQKKLDLTGAVATVSGEDLAERPVKNVTEALQGVVPGLQITANSGEVGSTMNINIRGTGTIGQGSSGSPLVLIDGVEGDINTINPQDIDNISVLKDAAASSIYGSRAPFGVILITTKNGDHGGKTRINYNNSFRFSNMVREKHSMNSLDFVSFINDAQTNSGQSVYFNSELVQRIQEWRSAKPYGPGTRQKADGTLIYSLPVDPNNSSIWGDGYSYGYDDNDWYGIVYKNTAFAQEHNASISGGSKVFNYYTSFNLLDNDGFINFGTENHRRMTGTAKITSQVTSWLSMSYYMRYSYNKFQRPTVLTSSLYDDIIRQGWPTLPLYDRNGYIYSSPSPALDLRDGGQTTSERDITSHQIDFIIEPIKNWQTHVNFNYKVDNTTGQEVRKYTYNHTPSQETVVKNQTSYDKESELKDKYLNFQVYSEYSWDFAQKHNFHVMAGFQTEQLKRLSFSERRDGLLNPDKPEIDLTNGISYNGSSVVPVLSGARDQWQTAGFFGRINYNYMERYLLEANLRYDGTSRFRRNKMWRTFPSFSVGWRISEEPFMKDTRSWLDNLKLRLSYGSLGNQNITNWYQTYQTITYSSSAGTWLQNGGSSDITAAPGLVSALLSWEKVESYNVGLDFTLLNNRLTGSFDYYVRNTKDMVGNAPELPDILGTSVPVTNNTDLRTNGWELQIGWHDTLNNGLFYSVTANLSDARTKITHYPNNPTNSIDNYIKGQYLNEIWGYTTKGLAKTDEEMQQHLSKVDQSGIGNNWAAGDIMYEDVNGDGRISAGSRTLADHGDLKIIGNSTPRYLFGIDLSGSWKGFDLRAFFQGVMKRDVALSSGYVNREYLFGVTSWGMWFSTPIKQVSDYFRDANTWSVQNGLQEANTNAWLPRVTYSDRNEEIQTRYLLNAAYMRLKNLQVGYTIPRSITQKWSIENLRVFFSAENVFTVTSLPSQFDPEVISNGGGGAYTNGYPLSRTFSFGINITL